jgi:hypothetical protein
VADMLVQIYLYRYRQIYRLGEYICIGIAIGWTHIGPTLVPSMSHPLELGFEKRTCKVGLINETEKANRFSSPFFQQIDCDKKNMFNANFCVSPNYFNNRTLCLPQQLRATL